jgi:hypothetical protein
MSTALAIASVTAVLKDLLNDNVINQNISDQMGAEVLVSALPPDRVDEEDKEPADRRNRLNLFLYQVTPNAGWRNVGLPSRDGNGDRTSNPPLALDLHYLLTAYGAEELHAEILLGYGMQLLHETPVLTRAAIRNSLVSPTMVEDPGLLPPRLRSLFTSELAEQIEQIKIVQQSLSTEEISRMWAAFQAKYRPTAAYQVSVVLIESRRSARLALPVRQRNLYVVPFRQPVIERLLSQQPPSGPFLPETDQPILPGYNLIIDGRQLHGDITEVSIDGVTAPTGNANITDAQIITPVPVGLLAGVHGVQVIQKRLMGTPEIGHRGDESNVVPFVLHPRITATTVNASNVQTATDGTRSADLTIPLDPPVDVRQRVILLLNELNPASDPARTYSFISTTRINLQAPPATPPPPQPSMTMRVSGVRDGTYLVRVKVDGAESPLGADPQGKFNSPTVAIP